MAPLARLCSPQLFIYSFLPPSSGWANTAGQERGNWVNIYGNYCRPRINLFSPPAPAAQWLHRVFMQSRTIRRREAPPWLILFAPNLRHFPTLFRSRLGRRDSCMTAASLWSEIGYTHTGRNNGDWSASLAKLWTCFDVLERWPNP